MALGISRNMTGTAWHSQQMSNTCKEGSKRCINNNNGICIFKGSLFYRNECVGKGDCEEFESMSGSPKTISSKTSATKSVSYHIEQTRPYKNKTREKLITQGMIKKTPIINQKTLDEKTYEFNRLSITRKDKILKSIKSLSNLSNINLYNYTDEQIDTIFDEIFKVLTETRNKFRQKRNI